MTAFLMIFSSLQSSGNATLLQTVRGNCSKNGERKITAKVTTYTNLIQVHKYFKK
jgi:peptidyl-tRNA hydrolase